MSTSHPPVLDAPGRRLAIADRTDASTILSLARAFHVEDGHPLSHRGECALEHLLTDQTDGLVFKIEASGGVIGYAVLCFGYSVELGGRDAFLDDFYIIPSERGHGLGHSVMDALIDVARKAGCRRGWANGAIGRVRLVIVAGPGRKTAFWCCSKIVARAILLPKAR